MKRLSYHHIETSQLTGCANQLTGFYMVVTYAFNEFIISPLSSIIHGESQINKNNKNQQFTNLSPLQTNVKLSHSEGTTQQISACSEISIKTLHYTKRLPSQSLQ